MKVELIQHTGKDFLPKILSVCRNKPCTEDTVYQCLKEKPIPHLSILEFMWFNFHVKGLSVKARIQLLRHRMFSTMERSTRHIDVSTSECIIPTTTIHDGVFDAYYEDALDNYSERITEEFKEDAAYLLPLGIETEFYLAGNGRVFFEYLQKRLCHRYVQAEHNEFAECLYEEFNRAGYGDIFQHARPCGNICDKCMVKE